MARSPASAPFVIAVDAGGTHTRVGCFALDGSLLSAAIGRAGAAHHDQDAARNVNETVVEALQRGHLDPGEAVALVAGVAGISAARSNQGNLTADWAQEYYALPSLTCPHTFVNDAVTAHRGALLGAPGVIVVAGTGSMILAITEDGTELESGQFEHYAGGARHLIFDIVHRILMGATTEADTGFVAQVLDHFGASDVPSLRRTLLGFEDVDRNQVKRRYGDLAPAVTAAAGSSPVADKALRALTDKAAHGVLVLAPLVGPEPVPVSVTGALASDAAFELRLRDSLAIPGTTPTRLVQPSLDPLGGAALLAYHLCGTAVDPGMIDRLRTGGGAAPAVCWPARTTGRVLGHLLP